MSDQDTKASLRNIDTHLKSIDGTLIRQEESLKHHIYRTDLAEEAIKALQGDLAPIKKTVVALEGVLKFLGAIAILAGMGAGVVQIIEFFVKK